MADDELVGMAEIRDMLKLSRQRVSILAKDPAFPEPIATVSGIRVWRRADIEAWAKATGRDHH